jgi:hypothetical protein
MLSIESAVLYSAQFVIRSWILELSMLLLSSREGEGGGVGW